MIVYVHMMGDRVLGVHTNIRSLENALKANHGSDYTIAPLDPKVDEDMVETPAGTFRKGERLWFWSIFQEKDKAATSGIFFDYKHKYGRKCFDLCGNECASYYDHCSREMPDHTKD